MELTRLAVQFLSNCILKILILNIKYIEKPKNSSKKIFKQQLLKNVTADFFAFTSIFQQNTLSLCRNCLLRGAFLKKGTMLIGRSVLSSGTHLIKRDFKNNCHFFSSNLLYGLKSQCYLRASQ